MTIERHSLQRGPDSRANGITERESTTPPDCEDEDIGHTLAHAPARRSPLPPPAMSFSVTRPRHPFPLGLLGETGWRALVAAADAADL
jgi:hypothetical protein